MSGTLIMCGTPIGNLSDVTNRLAETLSGADHIYAEDTRRTGQLLNHLGISVPMTSFFAGNERSRLDGLGERLSQGETVAIVTDAGMPVVSDPGASAVEVAVSVGATVTSVPGPSAVTTALAVSGFVGDRFCFEGFLPRKGAERTQRLEGIARDPRTTVLFSAPSRASKDLGALAELMPGRRVVIGRELTKLHEEVWRGTLDEATVEFADAARARGEFTIVVEGAPEQEAPMEEAVTDALASIAEGATTSDAVRRVAEERGVSRRELYESVLRAKP